MKTNEIILKPFSGYVVLYTCLQAMNEETSFNIFLNTRLAAGVEVERSQPVKLVMSSIKGLSH